MKILITGVAGFIGSNLADRLLSDTNKEYDVVGIDNLVYGVKEQIPDGVNFHQIDIRSKDIYPLFDNVDFVFHLAAKNCISDCQMEPVETMDINVTGTANVFEASKRAKVKKIIYAESSALYESSTVFPTPESEVKPKSFYSVSKFASMYLAEAYRRFFDSRFTALRYFCVYGPRQDYRRTIPPVMSSFIIRLLKGERPVIFGSGDKRRDFVHVDDVNDFHLKCLTDTRTDEKVFNIGSGVNYSVNDIYAILSKILALDVAPVFEKDLPGEAQRTLADIEAAQKIGWFPRVNILEGLNGMVDYIKSEMRLGRIL